VREFVDLARELGATRHVTQNLARPGAVRLTAARRVTAGTRKADAPAYRTGVRVAENHRVDPEGQTAWPCQCRGALRVRERGVQPDSFASAADDTGMTTATCFRSTVRLDRTTVRRLRAVD
jgi:hypothetical protein